MDDSDEDRAQGKNDRFANFARAICSAPAL